MISVIIVNYFNEDLILKCLESLFKFHPSEDLDIIIINNGGQLNNLKKVFTYKAKIIESGGNLGFSKANNLGIKHSMGQYILFLNPDTYFISNALSQCTQKLVSDTSIGLLGCRLLNPDLSLQLSYHDGNKVFQKLLYRNPIIIKFFRGSFRALKSMHTIKLLHETDHEADWLTGAFAMMRRKDILEHRFYWDEDFFMYWEDVELCFRIKKTGLKCYYTTAAELIHIGGSGENASSSRFEMMEKSKLRFIEKIKGRLIKNLYFSFMKMELRFEKFLVKRKKQANPSLQNEFNFYGISKITGKKTRQ